MFKIFPIIALFLCLPSCAAMNDPQRGFKGVTSPSVGKDGITWDDANTECSLEAAKVSGYDWIDAASNKAEVKELCLKTKGFRR